MKPKDHTWGQYLRNGLGLKLSKVGEALGIDFLTYNAVILELFHSIALENAPKVVAALRELYPEVRSIADIGCGSGAFAAEFQRSGISTFGFERSPHGIEMARKQGVDCRSFDVALASDDASVPAVDLVYSFEVAEHVPKELAGAFVRFVVARGDFVVFAAAQPGQGGIGHINEQPMTYWADLFGECGFELCPDETDAVRKAFLQRNTSNWFYNNSCVYRRR